MNQPIIRSELTGVAGDVWTAVIAGVQHIHSLILEAWGANTGIVRIQPDGRDEVHVQLILQAPGRTVMALTLRDARLGATHAYECEVDVAPRGAALRSRGPEVWVGANSTLPGVSLGGEAPPFKIVEAPRLQASASTGRYGGMNGPTDAEVGDTINVRFMTPTSAVSVKFEASNAVVGFVGPMPLYDVTAETSARMTAEGSATIYGTAYDNSGMAVHEATHVVQVRSKGADAPREKSLSDVAADLQRSMEQRMLSGLNRDR